MRELTDAAMYSFDNEGALVGTSDVLRYVTVTSCPLAMKTNDLADQTKAQQINFDYFSTTTDHAWEIKWLVDFFKFLLDSTGQAPDTLTCDSFKKYFFQKDKSGNTNRLEAVFNSLPSEQWMGGFALMTQYMNTFAKNLVADIPRLKSTIHNQSSPNKAVTGKMEVEQAIKFVEAKTALLRRMSIGCMTISYDPVMQRIKDTWKRIYQSLLEVDKVVSCNDFEASGDDGSDATGSGNNFESDVAPLSVAERFLAFSERLFNDEDHGINPQGRILVQRMIEATARDIDTLKSNHKYTKLSEEEKDKHGLEEQEAILKMIKDLGDTSDPDNRNWGVYFDVSTLANEGNNEAEAAGAVGSKDGDSTGKRDEDSGKRFYLALGFQQRGVPIDELEQQYCGYFDQLCK
ncbi:hypothetical protein KC343_g11296 [Hortaea werneckii]|nr:hypothetical protein KC352_g20847 [Hortaea werneckii]KAI7557668.1 hypothetical protein KC317_g11485 [Hortaea werneckii]KAI7605007.1 hypothetical protein KC346_g11219 [Hortaea werneckii]KAI7612174.1 hypothetical protein KC343_g11296 [Hortaea werneckii]KAI7650408.1 hypothetical protein KC319_g11065 [Hortaea werneckii]